MNTTTSDYCPECDMTVSRATGGYPCLCRQAIHDRCAARHWRRCPVEQARLEARDLAQEARP